MLARAFVRVHSSQNLSIEELSKRKRSIEENIDWLEMKGVGDANFTLLELKKEYLTRERWDML